MNRNDYESLKQQITEEYNKNMDALVRVYQMSKGIQAEEDACRPELRKASVNGKKRKHSQGNLEEKVKECLVLFVDDFTLKEVIAELENCHGIVAVSSSVQQVVARLRRKGVIEMVKGRHGTQPAFYRRVSVKTVESSVPIKEDSYARTTEPTC